jgi:hypothetical protein
MEAPTLKEVHPERCDWCDSDVGKLLNMIEEYVDSPEGKLDLAAEDLRRVNDSTEKKKEAWGF